MALLFGLALISTAGILQGSFYLPMTFTRKWEWEHTWSIFSLTGMIVFSWIFILLTVPDIFSVYAGTASRDVVILIIFGGLWGIGGVLNGLAMAKLGMALAYPIVLGTVSALGALIPLIVFFPSMIFAPKGLVLIAGTVVTLIGIIFCSRAFSHKEPPTASSSKSADGSITTKLAIAILAGVMSSLLNVGFAYSTGLIEAARNSGVSDAFAANAAWAIILTSGGCVNVLYCIYLMIKRSTAKQFIGTETVRNLGLGSLMGLFWCAGLYAYGFGSSLLGSMGVVVGWVLFMSAVIIIGNLWGIWRGEWKDAPQPARALLNRGLFTLIIAIIIVAVSNTL